VAGRGGGPSRVQFVQSTRTGDILGDVLSLFSAENGDRFLDYDVPSGLGDLIACYEPGSFTFLGGDQGRLAIKIATSE